MRAKTLDHVALWVTDRDRVADFAGRHLGMHVIERTERFTLVGSHARHGKLTLFAADGEREPGALVHVALRVSRLEVAARALPGDGAVREPRPGELEFDGDDGLVIRLVEAATEVDYDLDHVALRSARPDEAAEAYVEHGFDPAPAHPSGAPRVTVGGAFVEFHEGEPGVPESPLLHHLAVLVDSAEEHRAEAERRGLEFDDWVDAPNTLALFLRGPDGVRIEYVEHKPSFSLV